MCVGQWLINKPIGYWEDGENALLLNIGGCWKLCCWKADVETLYEVLVSMKSLVQLTRESEREKERGGREIQRDR